MITCRIDFYKREKHSIETDKIVVKNYEEALRYAQALRRVHGWDIKNIKLKQEERTKVHTFN